jgi:hypothetical protein
MKNKKKTAQERLEEVREALRSLPKHMVFRRQQLQQELEGLEKWLTRESEK